MLSAVHVRIQPTIRSTRRGNCRHYKPPDTAWLHVASHLRRSRCQLPVHIATSPHLVPVKSGVARHDARGPWPTSPASICKSARAHQAVQCLPPDKQEISECVCCKPDMSVALHGAWLILAQLCAMSSAKDKVQWHAALRSLQQTQTIMLL
jgi:hypothetical protein